MVRTRTDHIILWPTYFDARKSRATGRRVPKSVAVQDPTSEELFSVVKALGLEAKLMSEKSYPGSWWEHSGCVSVEKGLKKTELIEKVASKLKELKQISPANSD